LRYQLFQIFYFGGIGSYQRAVELVESVLTVPNLKATGALVSTISAPSATHCSATCQAIDWSLSAPKISPFFPFKIIFWLKWIFMKKILAERAKMLSN